MNRRTALRLRAASMTVPVAAVLSSGCTQPPQTGRSSAVEDFETESTSDNHLAHMGEFVKIHYLEIVTPDIDGACNLYSMMHGVSFGEPDQNLGGARTTELDRDDANGNFGLRSVRYCHSRWD